jgi:hypothetical protein
MAQPTSILAAALAVALATTVPALGSERLTAAFDIYTSGFRILGIEAEAELRPADYAMTIDIKTYGIVDWLLRFQARHRVEGRLASAPQPDVYRTGGTFRGRNRAVHMIYGNGGPRILELDPPDRDEDRDPVTPAMLPGTIDPLSIVVAINRSGDDGPCPPSVPVFDGRRRFNLKGEALGAESLEPNRYSAFSGVAKKCRVSMERIGGYMRNPTFGSRDPPPVTDVWMARFGGQGLWLPVRMEMTSWFGDVVGHMVRVNAEVRPLDRR